MCPVYCRFCTRSYSVGAQTESVSKKRFLPLRKYWEPMFDYIAQTPAVTDVVVSGGDTFFLEPQQLQEIGERLLSLENVRRIRFASKGLSVCPSRILDPDDGWANTLIALSEQGRAQGKSIALHTHFNHPQEISWISEQAAQHLFRHAVTVRNQTVLLNRVNNDVHTMKRLIRTLADINVQPVSSPAVPLPGEQVRLTGSTSITYTRGTWYGGWRISGPPCATFCTSNRRSAARSPAL